MKKINELLEFNVVLATLESHCHTEQAKEHSRNLASYLSESELLARLQETTEARKILDLMGTPPLFSDTELERLLITIQQGGMLLASELTYISNILHCTKRLQDFLNKAKGLEVGLAYYAEELQDLATIQEEIDTSIIDGHIDDYASSELRSIRRNISHLEEKIKEKANALLSTNKECYSEQFISMRNGHQCLLVKKEYQSRIKGTVIDKSQTGSTLFIEPNAISKLTGELEIYKMEEDAEERKILYTLSAFLTNDFSAFQKNRKILSTLDFIFAKGNLSKELNALCPIITTNRYLHIQKGIHPLLPQDSCVPLDFTIGDRIQGVIITGPNTGGKTVAIKTVALLSLMAQCGLHIPCEEATICMNSQILCDIGDGQNIAENLSTFSAHITNILSILKKVNNESLVILDELGSGTDPAEGMGIAIAILDELKKKRCLFIVTTHYPEVKTYAKKEQGIINARMAFDKETLKPQYRLEIGEAGESCALYIASKLGMPNAMIQRAHQEAYGIDKTSVIPVSKETRIPQNVGPRIQKKMEFIKEENPADRFEIGDSVMIYPEKSIGIVCKKANEKGEILVQLRKEKILINHKHLKLKVAASQLYPDDYDFSVLFDSVDNRKKRHQMQKKHRPDIEIITEE